MKTTKDRAAKDETAYGIKDASYFEGARKDFIDELPEDPEARILEIGCSNGNTGALALAMNKCGTYIGVEIHEAAALKAGEKISEVLTGDVERMELPWEDNSFDTLILSEVLEHLVDPWKILRKLHPYLKPGALVFASSPNVSHHRIIRMLLKGEWNLTDDGIMDRTHLRWFTPKTFAAMFEDSGYEVVKLEPMTPLKFQAKLQNALLLGKGEHLFIKQIKIKAIRKNSPAGS
ncbi:MAG: class I SAM-dependent methyltransferase [Gammaproteobacteria bacterium]|jgi:2-polyprenyl-3-methyl-5-hydroxy-6-metoxy-1,4-benzoquinol methylase